jgi:nucleoside-diphosphate-sugar epimerase
MAETYLVTGGSGLIGGYVVKALRERGDSVVVFDVKSPSPKMQWVLAPIWDQVPFIEGSISDDFPALLKCCEEYNVKKIFHAAAIFRGSFERSHPYYSLHVTIQGMLNVCEAARILKLGRIVFAGTNVEYVHLYQDYAQTPLTERDRMFDPQRGVGTYAAGKMAASIIGMCYHQTQGVDWVGTRFTRVWGFGSKTATSRNERLIENAVKGIPTIIAQDGDQKRNQCYIKDLTEGILLALDTKPEQLTQRVYNLSGPDELSDNEIVAVIRQLVPKAHISVTEGGVDRRAIDNTAAKQILGWEPQWRFQDAVKDYIKMFREFNHSHYAQDS